MWVFSVARSWWSKRTVASRLSHAVVGIAASFAVVYSFAKGDALLAGVFILAGMVSVIMMSLVDSAIKPNPETGGWVLLWLGHLIKFVVTLLFLGALILLFTSIFFNHPLKLMPGSKESDDNKGISIDAVQGLMRDSAGGTNAARLARAMARDATQLATVRLPITGDLTSTARLHLSNVDLTFLQGTNSIVKIEMFPILQGAKLVRGQSNRRYDDGNDFIAVSWGFVWHSGQLILCEHQDIDNVWQIPAILGTADGKDESFFVLLALYRDIHFFDGRADNITIEVDDLAGNVGSFGVTVGGNFKAFDFDKIFEFPASIPLRFIEVTPDRALSKNLRLGDIRKNLDNFFKLFANTFLHSNSTEEPGPKDVKEILQIWQSCNHKESLWKSIQVVNAEHDLDLFVIGEVLH